MAVRKINWENVASEMSNVGKKPAFEKKVDANLYKYRAKNGESTVLLRFLPAPVDDIELPYAEVFHHSYKNNGKLLLEKCPQSMSKTNKCPVCEHGTKLWRNGDKEDAKQFFHQVSYYVNVLIINDINTPENNGKIFVLKLGKSLFKKLKDKMSPSEEDKELGATAVNIFDYEEGLNFKLKISETVIKEKRNGEDYSYTVPRYDGSTWVDVPTKIGIDPKKPFTEQEIDEKIEKNLIPLKPYIFDDQKEYSALQERLNRVLGRSDESVEHSDGFEKTMAQTSSDKYAATNEDDDKEFLKNLLGG
jgi:hypothetical protein